MRIRTIKPEFFTDPDICDLPPLYRLAFIGLWNAADREGRMEDEPRRLKLHLLPCDNIDFDEVLQKLHTGGFIERYEINGNKYIQITNFLEHQRPNNREPESTIPKPLEHAQVNLRCLKYVQAEGEGEGERNREREEPAQTPEPPKPQPEKTAIPEELTAICFEAGWTAPESILSDWIDNRGWKPELIKEGLLAAFKSGKNRPAYIEAILADWTKNGKPRAREPDKRPARGVVAAADVPQAIKDKYAHLEDSS